MSGNKNIHGTYELYVEGYIYYTTMSGAWNLEGWRAYQEYIKAEVLNRSLPFWGVCVDARK